MDPGAILVVGFGFGLSAINFLSQNSFAQTCAIITHSNPSHPLVFCNELRVRNTPHPPRRMDKTMIVGKYLDEDFCIKRVLFGEEHRDFGV